MRIEHIAIWTQDLERLKTFYETHFAAAANEKYINPTKGFASYFLTFADGAFDLPGQRDVTRFPLQQAGEVSAECSRYAQALVG